MSTIYGNELNAYRLNIHDYLGMNLDNLETGVVKVLIIKYLQKVLEKFYRRVEGYIDQTDDGPYVSSKKGR